MSTFRTPGCVLFQWPCGVECDQETRFQDTGWTEPTRTIDGHLSSLDGSSEYQELDSSHLLLKKYRGPVRKKCGFRVEQDRGPAKFGASIPDL